MKAKAGETVSQAAVAKVQIKHCLSHAIRQKLYSINSQRGLEETGIRGKGGAPLLGKVEPVRLAESEIIISLPKSIPILSSLSPPLSEKRN